MCLSDLAEGQQNLPKITLAPGSYSQAKITEAHSKSYEPRADWEIEFVDLVQINSFSGGKFDSFCPFSMSASVDQKHWLPVYSSAQNRNPIEIVARFFRVDFRDCAPAVDEIQITTKKPTPSELVNIFMGTNNEGPHFSRGNQYPAVHTPFGMAAWSVGTVGMQEPWFYDYKDPYLTGIKLTHQPTVWGGDYGTLDVMPMTKGMSTDYIQRGSLYSRANESAHPYSYRNYLEKYKIGFEFVPSDRGAIFQFEYPEGETPYLVLHGVDSSHTKVQQLTPKSIEGKMTNGGVTTFFRAEFNRTIRNLTSSEILKAGIEFESDGNEKIILMKLSTSYISAKQAGDNLINELKLHTLETLKAETKGKWEKRLNQIKIEGGRPQDQMTFYSCLYRVFAFPKMHWEPIGTDLNSSQYHSPFDGKVHEGKKLWTGNGFWDTYRAEWPLFSILFPHMTGEMLDGWVNSYKDGGWTVRWSRPGYWESMIGTHTDLVFADAYTKGIRNWDFKTGYEASVKNAMVPGRGNGTGREFLERSAFLGYVPWSSAKPDNAANSRTIEDSISDFGISVLAKALGKENDALYFKNRALAYSNLWNHSTRHFGGKNARGQWGIESQVFDPFTWGDGWTEGNAWHYRVSPMHDGAGMAGLFGGRAELEKGLDEVLAADPHFNVGSYGTVIHEMSEAYVIGKKGFGQFAVGNEPIHHMLHMYAYAGKPSKTQFWVRRSLTELYESGFGNGYGFPGDEDEGEMSAWYVLNAMGFYSAAPGHGEYILSSPLFNSVTLSLENGRTFKIEAPANDEDHFYIESATWNNQVYDKPYLTHEAILKGGTLALSMSASPSDWGSKLENIPTSLTRMGEVPRYNPSLTQEAEVQGSGENAPLEVLKNLVDANSATKWLVHAPQAKLDFRLASSTAANCYTLTSANDFPARDPRSWKLLGSIDGTNWKVLDQRNSQTWKDRQQTQVFYFNNKVEFKFYRLEISENSGAPDLQLAEFELRRLTAE